MKNLLILSFFVSNLSIIFSNNLHKLENNPLYKGAIVSYQVCKRDGTVILEKNPDFLLVGASTWKLLSGLFILHQLGPDYQSQTKFWVQDKNLWIDSLGDPSITLEKVSLIKNNLKITEPLQNVYLKQAYNPGYNQQCELEDLKYYYSAPVTAWSYQGGTFKLEWKNEILSTFPFKEEIKYKKVPSLEKDWEYMPFNKKIIFYGSPSNLFSVTLPLAKPDTSLAKQFGKKIIKTLTMPHSRPDYILVGEKCSKLLATAIKKSDNWLIEQLYFMAVTKNNLDINEMSPTEQIKEGANRFKKFLSNILNLLENEYLFVQSACGLGRHNLLTVKALNKALLWNQKQPSGELFKQFMAVPGEEGTLKERLPGIKGYLKTGQMDRAVGLSGYITTPNGEERMVSIIVNGSAVPVPELRKYVDQYMALFSQNIICEK